MFRKQERETGYAVTVKYPRKKRRIMREGKERQDSEGELFPDSREREIGARSDVRNGKLRRLIQTCIHTLISEYPNGTGFEIFKTVLRPRVSQETSLRDSHRGVHNLSRYPLYRSTHVQ